MRIDIEVAFSFKRQLGDDHRSLELPDASDVTEALRTFVAANPSVRGRLFDAKGRILRHINALINGGNVKLRQGFETVLQDGDRLTILPPAGGG